MLKHKIFITGGSGMVGRNFMEHQSQDNYEVFAPSSKEVDLRNYDQIKNAIERFKPDTVIHCAGRVGGIQANMREPVSFLLDNLDMGRNLVWAAYKSGVKRLINLGSSCMYPRDSENPLDENKIMKGELEPTNEGYALAKVTVARLCEYITREHPSVCFKTLIPCNIYGRYDKFDPIHSHMVPAVILKLHEAKMKGLPVVDIWGNGEARREFMYAGDLADCMWECVRRFDDVPSLMNVGLGYDFSVNDYYKIAASVIGYSGKFEHDLSKPVGMKQKLVSVSKLEKWGWKAATTLESGLKQAHAYYVGVIKSERS